MDSPKLSLDKHLDEPEFSVTVNGETWHFSELPLACKAKLQAFINDRIPNPFQAVKPLLEGLDPEDRRHLLNEARKDALDWPPDIESSSGRLAILKSEPGQLELLFQGLTVHHPDITREKAQELLKALERDVKTAAKAARRQGRAYDGEGEVQKIYATLFGVTLPSDDEGIPRLKASSPQSQNGMTGAYSSADASES